MKHNQVKRGFITDDLNINLTINIDGLPLTKSASHSIWPILVQYDCSSLMNNPKKIFVVGLYYGLSKPSDVSEYFKHFLEEFTRLENGFEIDNMKCKLSIKCFTCDAPARQFIKNIKSHNAYQGCERCTTEGVFLKGVVFPEVNCVPRTHGSFLETELSEHHRGESPLTKLKIDLVDDIVLDPMHLLYLGVTRKLLSLWIKGSKGNVRTKLGSQIISQLSSISVSYTHLTLPTNREF